MLYACRYVDPEYFDCWTYEGDHPATIQKDLQFIVYTSSTGSRHYNYSDLIEFPVSGINVQVGHPTVSLGYDGAARLWTLVFTQLRFSMEHRVWVSIIAPG